MRVCLGYKFQLSCAQLRRLVNLRCGSANDNCWANGNLWQPSLAVDAASGILSLYNWRLAACIVHPAIYKLFEMCVFEFAVAEWVSERRKYISMREWDVCNFTSALIGERELLFVTAHIKMISEYSSTWLRSQFFSLAQRWIEAAAAPLDGMQARFTTAVLCKDNRLLCSVAECVKIRQFPSISNSIS